MSWNDISRGTLLGSGVETEIFTVTVLATEENFRAVSTISNSVVVTDDGTNGIDANFLNNTSVDITTVRPPFVYDGTRDESDFDNEDGNFFLRRPDPVFSLSPLPISPIYSGTTEPGTTLTLKLYDENGYSIGLQTVMADMAGNWVATFPNNILVDQPHHMGIQQTASVINNSTASGFNMRTYFSPATHAQLFFSSTVTVDSVFGRSPHTVLQSLHETLNNPLNLGWDDYYAYEYLAASSTPTDYAR